VSGRLGVSGFHGVLEFLGGVFCHKRGWQDPLEYLIHKVLKHLKPSAYDPHQFAQRSHHLDHVLLHVLAPAEKEPKISFFLSMGFPPSSTPLKKFKDRNYRVVYATTR
jgi:hypothetical protein